MSDEITHEVLVTVAAELVATLADKIHEAVTMARPGDVTDYADGLASAAAAYCNLVTALDD